MSTTIPRNTTAALAAGASADCTPGCSPAAGITRSLVGYGVVAGPLYVAVSLVQAVTRDGFDLRRHEWSLLANGPGGWIQVTNLVLTGLMVLAAAVGYARAMSSGIGARWVPRLLAVYGLGLVGAGIFRADPMRGFPAGTPDGPPVHPTAHGTLHLVAAGIGFLALLTALGLLAARFRRARRGRLTVFTIATGAAFLTAFATIASGSDAAAVNLTFTGAVILTWTWLTVTSIQQYRAVT